MNDILEISDVLRLIDERSTVFRAAIAAGIDLDAAVPNHPEWTLFDLVQHLSVGRRTWADTVGAGSTASMRSPWTVEPVVPSGNQVVLAWSAKATRQLGRRRGRLDRTPDMEHRGERRGRRRPEVPWPGTTYGKSRSLNTKRGSLLVRLKSCR